jgi:putative spermidine/putrescine transport system permease protein
MTLDAPPPSDRNRMDHDTTIAATVPPRLGASPGLAPYLLSAPALAVLATLLVVPLVATALLSLHSFSLYKGIENVYNFRNYADIFSDPYFYRIYARTFRIALIVTVLAVLLGAPEAYILNRMRDPWRRICLLLVLGPLFISIVSRTLGWALLFGSTGVVNQALMAVGAIDSPLQFMYSETGVVIALTHVLVPFVVISVWASLRRLDPHVENAAVSLGAGPATVLRRIVLPASAFATLAIIGGRRLQVAATLAYDEFLNTLNWPLGAAIAVLLVVANVVIVVGCNRLIERRYARVFE